MRRSVAVIVVLRAGVINVAVAMMWIIPDRRIERIDTRAEHHDGES